MVLAGTDAMPLVSFHDVQKTYRSLQGVDYPALEHFSLEIEVGEFFCLLGPSGCGKTTVLKMLAGFETPTAGRILMDGRPVTSASRDRGVVFQGDDSLYGWLNAVENFFSKMTRQRIRRGVFRSIADLQTAINAYLAEHNANPKPFVWTKSADAILAKLDRLPVSSECV